MLTSTDALLIAPRFHGADGVSVVSRQLLRALQAMQIDVQSWALADVERRDLVDAPVTGPDYSAEGRLELVLRGLASPWREHFGLVLVTHLHLLPAAVGHLARRTPLAVYLHGIECWDQLTRVRESLLGRADVLLANSSYTAARFIDANPRFFDRVVHICPPAAPQDIEPTELPPMPTVLVVGRLSQEERYKGHDALLNVWPAILDAIPQARLVIIGDGNDRRRLALRVRKEGLASSVSLPGLVSREELRRAYAACRVFAMPSGGEGFGIVFLEAMAAGRPCIAAYGAAEDVIDPGRTGLLVTPGDEPALQHALLCLLTDDDLARAMGSAGRLRVRAHFGDAAFATRLSRALGIEQARASA